MAGLLAELPISPQRYASDLASGVAEHQAEIDQLIAKHAIDWALDRMPVVDRALLRIATYELGWQADVPTSVIISEAVELAKQFSTDESSGFINGMLASISRQLRPDDPPGPTSGLPEVGASAELGPPQAGADA